MALGWPLSGRIRSFIFLFSLVLQRHSWPGYVHDVATRRRATSLSRARLRIAIAASQQQAFRIQIFSEADGPKEARERIDNMDALLADALESRQQRIQVEIWFQLAAARIAFM